jgi:guanosine-3',5'-bis(diphosphate) 3'-pyrophosphohydrolase
MNINKYKKEIDQELETAVVFLVDNFTKSGHNSKPVIFHSIKVAMYLYDLDYGKEMVIAGLLHDVVEDTDITISDVNEKFGEKVARMVDGLSFKSGIESKVEQYKEMFERTKEGGKDLLLIKCADVFQNSFFVGMNLSKDDYFLGKMKYLLDLSQESIGNERPWVDLKKRFEYMMANNTID